MMLGGSRGGMVALVAHVPWWRRRGGAACSSRAKPKHWSMAARCPQRWRGLSALRAGDAPGRWCPSGRPLGVAAIASRGHRWQHRADRRVPSTAPSSLREIDDHLEHQLGGPPGALAAGRPVELSLVSRLSGSRRCNRWPRRRARSSDTLRPSHKGRGRAMRYCIRSAAVGHRRLPLAAMAFTAVQSFRRGLGSLRPHRRH